MKMSSSVRTGSSQRHCLGAAKTDEHTRFEAEGNMG